MVFILTSKESPKSSKVASKLALSCVEQTGQSVQLVLLGLVLHIYPTCVFAYSYFDKREFFLTSLGKTENVTIQICHSNARGTRF